MTLLQTAGRWLLRGSLGLIALAALTYVADWASYRLEGSPQSTVTVNRTLEIPLKNNKEEYDYVGTFDEPCSVSLFPQEGLTPCWELRRNPNQNEKI